MMVILVALPALVFAAPAVAPNTVLILDSTVTGGMVSLESMKAIALGFNVELANSTTWASKTTADFASYKAIILGDPTCVDDPSPLVAAEANRTTWSAAITGNKVFVGTDPAYHAPDTPGAATLTEKAIAFAANAPTTGAYIALSCYYGEASSGTPVPVLDQFGTFTVVGPGGCPNASHIIAVHPALAGLTDADLSNWLCSTHEGFVTWPSTFLILAISEDVPSPFVAPDGTTGAPYIVAQGETLSPILCGNGKLDPGEECDDGNVTNGDGCSAQCKIEPPPASRCGNGILEAGEQCDDGNILDGDGCSATCKIENKPPKCDTGTASQGSLWPPDHRMVHITVQGVTDSDNNPVTVIVNSVKQDEPVNGLGNGDTYPDAVIHGDGSVDIRAERSSKGDGRVYHIGFVADDGQGGKCTGTVQVCVPHDQGKGQVCIDQGLLYDSLVP
jgi:cysteine-rich repeat protein